MQNVFKGKWTEETKELVLKNKRKMVPVPNVPTTNRRYKAFLREEYQR